MGYADLHIHSLHSYDGTASISAIFKYASTWTDLKVLAITDHDTLSGDSEAMDLAPKYNLQAISGCEVSSNDGHVICLFIKKLIPSGLSLLETVLRTAEQGGLCIAPHPQAIGVNGLRFSSIRTVLKNSDAARTLVGVEAYNGGAILSRGNQFIIKEAQSLSIAQLGNSDAHILKMVGLGSSWFEGNTVQDLKIALINHTTIPRFGLGLSPMAVITSYIPAILLRKLGWVRWNASPEAPICLANWMKIRTLKAVSNSV
jgi:predicted metal-dependent phosphoesterase TrpH